MSIERLAHCAHYLGDRVAIAYSPTIVMAREVGCMVKLVRVFFALIIFALAGVLPAAAELARTVTFTLVFYCDVYDMAAAASGRGGMARIAAVVAAERAASRNVIVVHGGDTISPSLMSGIDRGAHMIDLLNLSPPDIFIPGNHEYDFGAEIFGKRMAEARFPVLAANLSGPDGGRLAGIASHRMFNFDGLRIAVIGLTADDSPTRSSPGRLKFANTADTARRLAATLRKQGADLIVIAAHARRDQDRELIADRAGDIILSGDDHDLALRFDGKTAFIEAMRDGLYVAAVDIKASISTRNGRKKVRWWPNFRLLDTAKFAPDKAVSARVAAYQATLSRELDVAIAVAGSDFDSLNATVRGGEAAIANLFADAIRVATDADVALINGGGLRGKKRYLKGQSITRRDILKELPFANKTFVLEVTGRQLRQALEQGLARAENLTGAFPQVSGMRVRADLSRPVGQRVVRLEIGHRPIADDQRLRLATNDFLARGGDGYEALKSARRLTGDADGKLIANHVMAYIRRQGTVAPTIENRIVVSRAKAAQ